MHMKRLVPAALTAVLIGVPAAEAQRPVVSAPISNVRYSVRFDRTTSPERMLDVAMTFGVAGRDAVLLSVPSWTPGAYEISNFARDISGFAVTGTGGSPRWDKLDPDTWRIVPNGATSLRVSFSFLADSMDNAMAWTKPDFAFFNGTNVFPYPEGRSTDFAATVTIETEAEWQVATGMTAERTPRTYSAANYHDLVDMPFFVGALEVDSLQVSGSWVRTATYPRGVMSGEDRAAFWRQVEGMIPPMVRIFGDMTPTYTNLIVFDSTMEGASALEHANSHLGIYSPFIVGHEFLPSITAHEIFHLWNVKRMRPADMVPYRYDRAQPTTWLWVSEGITDYYADIAQVRGGVLDSAGFLRVTSGKMQEVDDAPAAALEDMSLSTWIGPTDGTHYLYYQKGSLAGLMLDILIRDATDNARSLDDVMRSVYQATGKVGKGFTSQDWWGAVSRAAGGRSFAEFQAKYIDGREPYPWDSILPLAGMRIQVDSVRDPWPGLRTMGDSSGIFVTVIEPGSPASEVDVQVGDYILTIGSVSLTDPGFAARFRSLYARESGEVPIEIRRGTETRTVTLRVAHRIRTFEQLAFDRNASPKALRIRSGLLRGM